MNGCVFRFTGFCCQPFAVHVRALIVKYALTLFVNYVLAFFVNYIAYLQGLSAGETTDDEFCEQLYNSYLNSTDKGDAVSFEKMAEMCGVNPNEL